MTGNPTALRLEDALQVDEARRAVHIIALRRREARTALERAENDLADKQRLYRRAKADAYVKRADMRPADAQKVAVEADAADAEYARDVARGLVKAQEELLKEIDGERASLHRLLDWSMKLDPYADEGQVERSRPRAAA
jgi:hypothetical protein